MSSEFRFLRAVALTDAMLTSSDVPEAVVPTYSGATTYAAGQRAGPAPVYGSAQAVWESKQNGNTGNAQVAGVWWKFVGYVYPEYNSGSSCGVGGIVTDLTNHLLYESLVAGNTGNPLTDTLKWLLLGSTNRWKMLDEKYTTKTTNADQIEAVVTPGEIVTELALLNVEGATATVTQSITGFTETVSLSSHLVDNWYDFYYQALVRISDVVFTEIPPYPASTLTVRIDAPESTAACGVLMMGQAVYIGTTNSNLSRSINDYSRARENSFGDIELQQGNYAKRMVVEVLIPEDYTSEATRLLEEFRATPTVFIAVDDIPMAIVYGFLGPWTTYSARGKPASIEIRGLT